MKLRYNLHKEPESENVVIILPGSSGGMNQSLVRGVFDEAASRGFSVITFDYPGFVRGDSELSEDLSEEVEAFVHVTDILAEGSRQKLHIIGKSLGAIVASKALAQDNTENPLFSIEPVKLTVLGCVAKDIDFSGLQRVDLEIVQGEHDRFGSPAEVSRVLAHHQLTANITGINGATHSFRDHPSDKKPVHEAEAIAAITWLD